MSRLLEAFNCFYQVACRVITVGEEMAEKSSRLLKAGYPTTKEEHLGLCYSGVAGSKEILSLGADLLATKQFSGYEDVREMAVELISRMAVVARAFEDIKKILMMYGHEPDLLQFSQSKVAMATAVNHLQQTLEEFRMLHQRKRWKLFETITDLIPDVEGTERVGWWMFDQKPKNPGEPSTAPYVHYEALPTRVVTSVYKFVEEYPEYQLPDAWPYILDEHGIAWSDPGMMEADVGSLDDRCIFALVIGVCNAERFSDGTLGRFFHEGTMLRWLKRLDELDVLC